MYNILFMFAKSTITVYCKVIFTSCIKIFIPPVAPKKIMLVYQFYITFPLLIDCTQEISAYICPFLLLFLPSVNQPSFLDALKFHYLLYVVYILDNG